jgi:dolichol kinase
LVCGVVVVGAGDSPASMIGLSVGEVVYKSGDSEGKLVDDSLGAAVFVDFFIFFVDFLLFFLVPFPLLVRGVVVGRGDSSASVVELSDGIVDGSELGSVLVFALGALLGITV